MQNGRTPVHWMVPFELQLPSIEAGVEDQQMRAAGEAWGRAYAGREEGGVGQA